MAYTGQVTPKNTEEQLGAFSGYIRRPMPSVTGMMAQIFGENGDDADTILALSLSKYQDAQIFVNMYLVKDADGQIMKKDDGYPLICSFLGFVRRSKPSKEGMIAQFFAPNGENSDEVAKLSKSEYQDALVFVDVRGSLAIKDKDQIQQQNIQEISKNYLNKLTKPEKEEINRKEKAYKKLNELLELDFLSRIEVLRSLGTPEDFKNWILLKQSCAHAQEKSCSNDSGVVKLDGLLQPFNYLPACDEHTNEMMTPQHFNDNALYYEMRHRLLLKQWAIEELRKKFAEGGYSEPNPARVIEWSAGKGIAKYLPTKYQAIF